MRMYTFISQHSCAIIFPIYRHGPWFNHFQLSAVVVSHSSLAMSMDARGVPDSSGSWEPPRLFRESAMEEAEFTEKQGL